MKSTRRMSLLLIASVLAVGLVQSTRANLVLNGSFETGDTTSWEYTPAASGSVFHIAPYISAAYGVQINPQSGSFLAEFGANQGLNDTLSQTVATVNGGRYDFTFWVNNLDGQNASYLTVSWGNSVVLQINDTSANSDWTLYNFVETATGPTTISFAGRNRPSYIGLDNVSVTAVPEPTTMVAGLGALGFVLMAFRARCRR